MALITTNRYSNIFLKNRRLIIDSDILIDIAKNNQAELEQIILLGYTCIICSPSIIEVGLGDRQSNEFKLSNKIFDIALKGDVYSTDDLHIAEFNKKKISNIFVYNPSPMEWLFAKNILTDYISIAKPIKVHYQKLQFDAIIYACAWNCRASIITNNTNDFMNFNKWQQYSKLKDGTGRYMPLYTFNDFLMSSKKDVSFPENILSS